MDRLRQFDAIRLDDSLNDLVLSKLLSVLQKFHIFPASYVPEISAGVHLIMEMGSVLLWRKTYGQSLAALETAQTTLHGGNLQPSLKRLLLRTCFFKYLRKRKGDLKYLLQSRRSRGYVQHVLGTELFFERFQTSLAYCCKRLEQVISVLETANKVAFLWNGTYPRLIDRALRLTYSKGNSSTTLLPSLAFLQDEFVIQGTAYFSCLCRMHYLILTSLFEAALVFLQQIMRLHMELPPWLKGYFWQIDGSSSQESHCTLPLHRCGCCGRNCIQLPCSGSCGHVFCFSCAVFAFTRQGELVCKYCGITSRPLELTARAQIN
eukprot:gene2543-5463_t